MVAARAISQALLWLLTTATCMFALDQLARDLTARIASFKLMERPAPH